MEIVLITLTLPIMKSLDSDFYILVFNNIKLLSELKKFLHTVSNCPMTIYHGAIYKTYLCIDSWTPSQLCNQASLLKLLSAICFQICIFNEMIGLQKYEKCLFHLKSCFPSQDIQFFVIFSPTFHTFQIQKGKWKWNIMS